MALHLAPGTAWAEALARAVAAAPEAFDRGAGGDITLRNLTGGRWHSIGTPSEVRTPVDNTPLARLSRVDAEVARAAVASAAAAHRVWSATPLPERKARVTAALDELAAHRDTLALLLVWEIGKPWRLARADVDRALDGVRWYVEQIDRQLAGRDPLPELDFEIASASWPERVVSEV
jgi:acyl-CoA reductase-like NAD-dependent aldehyde dehydrogenase